MSNNNQSTSKRQESRSKKKSSKAQPTRDTQAIYDKPFAEKLATILKSTDDIVIHSGSRSMTVPRDRISKIFTCGAQKENATDKVVASASASKPSSSTAHSIKVPATTESAPAKPAVSTASSTRPGLNCNMCNSHFTSAPEFRTHMRSDHHKYNLSRMREGKNSISASVFARMTADEDFYDVVDANGAYTEDQASLTDEPSADSPVTFTQSDAAGLTAQFASILGIAQPEADADAEAEPADTASSDSEDGWVSNSSDDGLDWAADDTNASDDDADADADVPSSGSDSDSEAVLGDSSPFLTVSLARGDAQLTVRKALLLPKKTTFPSTVAAAAGALSQLRFLPIHTRKVAIFMSAGGRFAACILDQGRVTRHKTLQNYTTRRKQGGSQLAYDKSGGGAGSVGAQIRRQQTIRFRERTRELLFSWRADIAAAGQVVVVAPGLEKKNLFMDAAQAERWRTSGGGFECPDYALRYADDADEQRLGRGKGKTDGAVPTGKWVAVGEQDVESILFARPRHPQLHACGPEMEHCYLLHPRDPRLRAAGTVNKAPSLAEATRLATLLTNEASAEMEEIARRGNRKRGRRGPRDAGAASDSDSDSGDDASPSSPASAPASAGEEIPDPALPALDPALAAFYRARVRPVLVAALRLGFAMAPARGDAAAPDGASAVRADNPYFAGAPAGDAVAGADADPSARRSALKRWCARHYRAYSCLPVVARIAELFQTFVALPVPTAAAAATTTTDDAEVEVDAQAELPPSAEWLAAEAQLESLRLEVLFTEHYLAKHAVVYPASALARQLAKYKARLAEVEKSNPRALASPAFATVLCAAAHEDAVAAAAGDADADADAGTPAQLSVLAPVDLPVDACFARIPAGPAADTKRAVLDKYISTLPAADRVPLASLLAQTLLHLVLLPESLNTALTAEKGRGPLHLACALQVPWTIVHVMVLLGADPAKKDAFGCAPTSLLRNTYVGNGLRQDWVDFASSHPKLHRWDAAGVEVVDLVAAEAARAQQEAARRAKAEEEAAARREREELKKEQARKRQEQEAARQAERAKGEAARLAQRAAEQERLRAKRDADRSVTQAQQAYASKVGEMSMREKRIDAYNRRVAAQKAQALGLVGDMCGMCGTPIIAIPFERLEYKYCTIKCLQAHRTQLDR